MNSNSIAVYGSLLIQVVFVVPLVLGALRWIFDLRSVQSMHGGRLDALEKALEKRDDLMARRMEECNHTATALSVQVEKLMGLSDRVDRLSQRFRDQADSRD